MNLLKLDYLVYSSHKTSTQSLISTLNNNKLATIHCHIIDNFRANNNFKSLNNNQLKHYFMNELIRYKNINRKKLKIVSILRNPIDRLLSSFFQTHHSDKIHFFNIPEKETIISKLNEEQILKIYCEDINNKTFFITGGAIESIDELSSIFNKDLIKELKKHNDYYHVESELFELYVLDFNKIIGGNSLEYINKCLKTNLKNISTFNLTENKLYYNKYKYVKEKIPENIKNIIRQQYKDFYFHAFNS